MNSQLSNMGKTEARDFLREHAGQNVCVTYKHDQDGKIQYQTDAPAPTPDIVPVASLLRSRKKQDGPRRPVAAAGLAMAVAACTPHGQDEPTPKTDPVEVVQPVGEMEVVETPPTLPDYPLEPMPMGAIAVPDIEPEPIVEVEGEIAVPLGDIAVPEDLDGDGEFAPPPPDDTVAQEPCDGPPPSAQRPYEPLPERPAVRGRIKAPSFDDDPLGGL